MQRTFIHSNSMETPPQTSLDINTIEQITASVSAAVLQQVMMHMKTTGGVHQSQSNQTLTPQTSQSNHMLTPQSSQSNYMLTSPNQIITTSLRQSDQMLSPPSPKNMEPSLIGSECRTMSESTTSISCIEQSTSKQKKKNALPTTHRHYLSAPMHLTFSEFEQRLKDKLPDAVMESELLKKFPSLHQFRLAYIIPLAAMYPGQKQIELSITDPAFLAGFLGSYRSIFTAGCHIRREPRKAGVKPIPETKERIMYRITIKDIWELLG